MSAWKVGTDQWEDWALQDVVRTGAEGGFDEVDDQVRGYIERLRLPTDVEVTIVDQAPVPPEEDAETVVRAAPTRPTESADPGMSGARTVVRQAPAGDALSVELKAPEAGELEVTLVTPTPSEPAAAATPPPLPEPMAEPAVATAPPMPEPMAEPAGAATPPPEPEPAGATPPPLPEPVPPPPPSETTTPRDPPADAVPTEVHPDDTPTSETDDEMFIPALIRPASAAEVAYDEDDEDDADDVAPEAAAVAGPPPLPLPLPPPPPPGDFDPDYNSGPIMVGDVNDSARVSGEFGVPTAPVAGAMRTGGELGSAAGELGGGREPEPVVPKAKIVVDPSASGAFERVDHEIDEEELDEFDLVEADEPVEVAAVEIHEEPPVAPPPVAATRPAAAVTPARTGATLPPPPADKAWVEAAFGEHFFALHHDSHAHQAAREVDFMIRSTQIGPGARVLDVGCGDGAHALAFAGRGLNVVAFDASPPQVARAQAMAERAGAAVTAMLGDMRDPPVGDEYDLVVSIGSTLGFFDDATNQLCVQQMADRVRPGGHLVLHAFNRDRIVGRLPARSWWQGNGCLVLDEASFTSRSCRLTIHRTVVFEDGRQFDFTLEQRAYGAFELEGMCTAAGLDTLECSGSIHTRGTLYGAMSPDIWLVAHKPG